VKNQALPPFLLGKSKLVGLPRLENHTYVPDTLAVKITLKLKYHYPTMYNPGLFGGKTKKSMFFRSIN
jgi:hypothetical protein